MEKFGKLSKNITTASSNTFRWKNKNSNDKKNVYEKKNSMKNVVVSVKISLRRDKIVDFIDYQNQRPSQPLPNQNRTFFVDRNFADITQLCRLHGHGRFPVNEGETIKVFYLQNFQFVCVGLDNDGN